MIFRQISYGPDGCASYLLGCSRAKEAVLVDPLASLGAETYLMEAADRGLEIRFVIDTHTHADHLSCGREVAAMTGAVYCLSEAARLLVNFAFTPLRDGDVIRVGAVELKVIATPGHTPDSICLLGTDHSRCAEPWFILTGDTLFVGDVGRPDLLVGDMTLDLYAARERAEMLHQSIRERLLTLPDHVEIYPGHFGGSACGGANMSGKACSTVHFERRYNLALQHQNPADFSDFVVGGLKPLPRDYKRIKLHNLGLREDQRAST